MSGQPRVLIVGNAGQVGVELQRSFADSCEVIGVDRESVDLAQPDQVRSMVRRVEPGIILNAAAYTAAKAAPACLGFPFRATWFLYSGLSRSANEVGACLTTFEL